MQTPPGWYVDPTLPRTQRYWDGTQWTQYTDALAPGYPPTTAPQRSTGVMIAVIVAVVFATIIIIGILAGVAIPVFFSQRKKAVDKAVVGDVVNTTLSMEGYYSINNRYPTSAQQALNGSPSTDFVVSAGTSVIVTTDGITGFCIGATNPGSSYATVAKSYDTNNGGLQADGLGCTQNYAHSFTLP